MKEKSIRDVIIWIFDIRPSEFLQHGVIGAQRPSAGESGDLFEDRGKNTTIVTLDMATTQAIILQ